MSILAGAGLQGQTAAPAAMAVGPTYFSTTGARYSYYDRTLTETTNLGIRLTKTTTQDVPGGLWTVVSIDATPRSQASTAALAGSPLLPRRGGRRQPDPLRQYRGRRHHQHNLGGGTAGGAVSTSLLGNLQGGMGFSVAGIHAFNRSSKVNCIADLDYELNSVSSQAVKPIVGLTVGAAF